MAYRDNGLRQEDYIYGLDWDVKVVTLFIDVLADQARIGNFNPNGYGNRNAISTAQYVINKCFKKDFKLKDCLTQVRLLRQRHSTFGAILQRSDIGWDAEHNDLAMLDETWAEIVKADSFAWAYAHCGDPHWKDLEVMFGPPKPLEAITPSCKAKDEVIEISDGVLPPPVIKPYVPLDEVITISSDTRGSRSTNHFIDNLSDDEGSFASPSIKTEVSTTNPKGKGKVDEILSKLSRSTTVSSTLPLTPNAKKV